MKARRGSGHCPGPRCKDGLIALTIVFAEFFVQLARPSNIRWKWGSPDLLKSGGQAKFVIELNGPHSAGVALDQCGLQAAILQLNPLAGLEPPPGVDERFPESGLEFLHKKKLNRSSRASGSAKAAVKNPRVVEDEQVILSKAVDYLEESPVVDPFRTLVKNHQARVVTGLHGALSYQRSRQFVVVGGYIFEKIG
jgi:hypothetical protein